MLICMIIVCKTNKSYQFRIVNAWRFVADGTTAALLYVQLCGVKQRVVNVPI